MEEYSTFDVARIFDIDRTRLQQWLDDNYFKPFRKAQGKGSKTIFTREDLYRLRFFIWLLQIGRSRIDAMDESNIEFKNVGPEKDKFKYAISIGSIKRGALTLGRFEVRKERPQLNMDDSTLFIITSNLLAIKKEVDGLIAQKA